MDHFPSSSSRIFSRAKFICEKRNIVVYNDNINSLNIFSELRNTYTCPVQKLLDETIGGKTIFFAIHYVYQYDK